MGSEDLKCGGLQRYTSNVIFEVYGEDDFEIRILKDNILLKPFGDEFVGI